MKIRETPLFAETRRLFLLFDYLMWLIFDPSKFVSIDLKKIKKVIVVHLGAIGELLAITPIISALKSNFNNIDVLIRKGGKEIFEKNPNITNILIFNENMSENISLLKKKKYDLAVIVSPASFGIIMACKKAGIKYRIGGFGGLKRFPTFPLNRRSFPIIKKHSVEKGMDILRTIGITNKDAKMEFYFSKDDEKSAQEKLGKDYKENYIIIHPGFGLLKDGEYPSRLWPPERYAKTIDKLIEKFRVKILLTGTKDEKYLSSYIFNKVKNKKKVRVTNGLFTLRELGVVVSKAKMVIAPDTSVIHIASCFNIPTIDLMSKRRDLYEWRPLASSYKILFSSKTKFNTNKPKRIALEGILGIEADDVIKAATDMIGK